MFWNNYLNAFSRKWNNLIFIIRLPVLTHMFNSLVTRNSFTCRGVNSNSVYSLKPLTYMRYINISALNTNVGCTCTCHSYPGFRVTILIRGVQQSRCSRMPAKICVAGGGIFGERSRTQALLNTPWAALCPYIAWFVC